VVNVLFDSHCINSYNVIVEWLYTTSLLVCGWSCYGHLMYALSTFILFMNTFILLTLFLLYGLFALAPTKKFKDGANPLLLRSSPSVDFCYSVKLGCDSDGVNLVVYVYVRVRRLFESEPAVWFVH